MIGGRPDALESFIADIRADADPVWPNSKAKAAGAKQFS
jgi:hypothetical protein